MAYNRSKESEISEAVLSVAAKQPGGLAAFDVLYREIPRVMELSPEDQRVSQTRPNDELWIQQVRNIQSNHKQPGNFIFEGYLQHVPRTGYRITDAGRRRLESRPT